MTDDLRSLVNSYFDIRYDVSADPPLLKEALRLRYQV